MTLQEIAAILGVSHQAVSQIEARALRKVLKGLQAHGLTYEDLEHVLKFEE